ncbi:MAG: hypothetical protein AAF514_05390 [Verrucomicrobiota bacterium]
MIKRIPIPLGLAAQSDAAVAAACTVAKANQASVFGLTIAAPSDQKKNDTTALKALFH